MERTIGARSHTRVRAMVECAMLISAYIVLSRIKFFTLPQGGDITPAAGLPLLLVGYRHGWKWGCISAAAATLLGILLDGFYPPPAGTFFSFFLCLLLDYFLAKLAVVSAAGITHLLRKKSTFTVCVSVLVSQLLRFLCAFLSGFLLWAVYAPEGVGPVYYSFTYNGSYCIPEGILTMVVTAALFHTAPRLFNRQ